MNLQRRKDQNFERRSPKPPPTGMLYGNAADLVMAIHFAFVLFVPFGALLALRWSWIPWVHLPAAGWGVFVSVTGGACPLTDAEKALRAIAGEPGYSGGFIEHYLGGAIHPAAFTRYALLATVTAVNALAYGWLHLRWLRTRRARAS
jgi:uncharacterized protein DUF2784